jgi:undecaprenyl diphosphate synthase
LIRTGGEQRISNFLLWNLAYSELYFSDCLWPDFRERQFDEAMLFYGMRQRRYGHTSEQVEAV